MDLGDVGPAGELLGDYAAGILAKAAANPLSWLHRTLEEMRRPWGCAVCSAVSSFDEAR
jgi:hypothetical protein